MNDPNLSVEASPRLKRPYVTFLIVALNVAVFAWELAKGQQGEAWVLSHLGQEKFAVWKGDYWRLLTMTFVHAGLAHFALNMFMLVYLGRVLELILGHWRYTVLYFLSGLAGSLLFQAVSKSSLGVGASGCIYGVFGSLLLVVKGRTPEGKLHLGWPFLRWAALVVVLDQVFAFVIESGGQFGICTSAHLGGFVTGSTLTYYYALRRAEGSLRWRRRLVGAALFLSLAFLFFYGCFYTVHDPDWLALREIQALREAILRKDFDRAVERWRSSVERDRSEKRQIGYMLFDSLMAFDREDLAKAVLDELIASAKEDLKNPRESGDALAELYNEIAWYHAMRGTNLQEALERSEHAVEWIRKRAPGGILNWLLQALESRETESKYVNTRGWIEFLLGKNEPALKDLKEAAELSPLGANFLYLALAHQQLGNVKEAREAARKAKASGSLSPYELKLLEDLRGNLGGF